MNSPLSHLLHHPGIDAGVSLYLKRDDLLHPVIQGSKWRKLAPIISLLQAGHYQGILTFGGPFSNHLHAVAAAGLHYGFSTLALVRGETADLSNPTLAYAQSCGMRLFRIPKKEYDTATNSPVMQAILADYADYYRLPAGGATPMAVQNCMGIAQEIKTQLPEIAPENLWVAVPAGTGSTAAGVIMGLGTAGKVLVFPAAAYGVSAASIGALAREAGLTSLPPFVFQDAYVLGGFATYRPALIEFAQRFQNQNGILLDPLYTLKMMFGLFDLLEKGYFPTGASVVALHTGGLQGWAGFRQRFNLPPL